jgi:hypothetical protein
METPLRITERDCPRPSPGSDRRQERRFPVVNIGILYSPMEERCLDNAGQLMREAVAVDVSLRGVSFDVREPLAQGDELLIELDNPGGPAERILAEVRWCRKIDDAHYRIGDRNLLARKQQDRQYENLHLTSSS